MVVGTPYEELNALLISLCGEAKKQGMNLHAVRNKTGHVWNDGKCANLICVAIQNTHVRIELI